MTFSHLIFAVNNLNSIFVVMDTIETPAEPVGSDGATSSPDTSAQVDTQPAESPEVVSANEGGEAEAPEVLLEGKYMNPGELEKAYKEVEGKLGGLGQKASVADLIQEKYGLTPEQFQATLEAEEQARLEQEYATNPAGYALREVQELKGQLALKEEEGKLNSFIQTNPEYAPFKDKIFDIGLNLQKYKGYDEIAKEWFGEAIATGQKGAYKKIEVKKMGQSTSVTSTPKKQVSEDDLRNLSAAELEAMLPHADISGRL